MSLRATLLIADDHPLVLRGLQELIASTPGLEVLGICSDGAEALEQIRSRRPDVALLDVAMPGMSGIDVLFAVRSEEIPTRIVLLTASLTDSQVVEAVAGGADGVIFKDSAPDDLIDCISEVMRGRRWLREDHLAVARRKAPRTRADDLLSKVLTTREREIAYAVAKGYPNKQIARDLNVSEGTIKIHLHNIYGKLGLRNRAELAAFTVRHARRPQDGAGSQSS